MWVGVDSALSQLLRPPAPERAVAARAARGRSDLVGWQGEVQGGEVEGQRCGGQSLEGGGERNRLIQDPRKDEPEKFKGRSTHFGIGGTKFWDTLGL